MPPKQAMIASFREPWYLKYRLPVVRARGRPDPMGFQAGLATSVAATAERHDR